MDVIEAGKPQVKEVRFQHFRRVRLANGFMALLRQHQWKERGLTPEPRGGFTNARVTLEDGTVVEAQAECSLKDNYSKKLGRQVALGRALKEAA